MDITFTGVDEWTSLEDLSDLWRRYPRVEFAALVGSSTRFTRTSAMIRSKPRFPSRATVSALMGVSVALGSPVAIHFCGMASRQIYDRVFVNVLDMSHGFTRVQVNASSGGYNFTALKEFAELLGPNQRVIMQVRDTSDVVPVHPKIQYLHDRSGGRGIADFGCWLAPPRSNLRFGYAGGLTAETLHEALGRLDKWKGDSWLDMESGVRTNDRFDITKVEKVCRLLWGTRDTTCLR